MSKLSETKVRMIKEEILSLLYSKSPKPLFTNEIAKHLIRDEEFIKRLLIELKKNNLVKEVNKSANGYKYIRWRRWTLSSKAYTAYKTLV